MKKIFKKQEILSKLDREIKVMEKKLKSGL